MRIAKPRLHPAAQGPGSDVPRLGAVICASLLFIAGCSVLGGRGGYSDVRIENAAVEMPLSDGQPALIKFDIAWGNSFRDPLNWDAVWVFAKYRQEGGTWQHATLDIEPTAHAIAVNNGVLARLAPAPDGLGIFLLRAEEGFSSIDWDQVSLVWDFRADGVERTATVEVEVIGLEMVYIPEGPFMLGDGMSVEGRMAAQFESGTSGRPYEVGSEAAIIPRWLRPRQSRQPTIARSRATRHSSFGMTSERVPGRACRPSFPRALAPSTS